MDTERFTIEHTTTSGFDLDITPFPPYYADLVEDVYPLKEYPKRVIELLAGDVVTEEYEPPEDKPDEDHEDYHLWLKWHEAKDYNDTIEPVRIRVRRDMLLSLCVTVKDGPEDISDSAWIERIETPFGGDYHVSDEPGQRHLTFLKYIVLTHSEDTDFVLQQAMFPEVTLQGVGRALIGFRGDLGRFTANGDSGEGQQKQEKQAES